MVSAVRAGGHQGDGAARTQRSAALPGQCALLAVLLFLIAPPSPAAAGPDHSPIRGCMDVYMHMGEEKRHAARDAVQALQAIGSQLGQMRLGRPLPRAPPHGAASAGAGAPPPTQQQLEAWRSGNATRLRALLAGTGLGGGEMAALALAHTCLSARLHPDCFAGRPGVSILLNYFKRPHVVAPLAAAMYQNCQDAGVTCELVVNVDNPHEVGSWVGQVVGGSSGGNSSSSSDASSSAAGSSSSSSSNSNSHGSGGGDSFLVPVFSDNLHESRGYNRAAKLARGRHLVIWQDDQLPPRSGQWLRALLALMAAYPRLGVLGMNKFRLCRQKETNNKWGRTGWLPDGRAGGVPWTFAHLVDFAPMAVRRSVFSEVGGLDEGVSLKGECGITGDWELCARAWMAGWQVGFSAMEGRVEDREAPSGTHTPVSGEQCWGRQALVGGRVLHMRYAASLPLFEEMCTHVRALNALAFSHDPSPTAAAAGAFCPYRLDRFSHFPSDWANCSAPPEADVAAVAAAWQLALPPLPPGANVSERLGKGLGYPQAAPAGVTAGAGGAGAGAGAGGARALGQVGQGRRRAGSMRRRRGRRRALLGVKGVDGEEEQDVQQAAAEEQEAEGVMWGERSELLM